MTLKPHTHLVGNTCLAIARHVVAAVSVLAVASALAFIAVPTPAQALTTNKATARPNESGGDGVVGGENTRLTWEGTVGDAEQVSSITLTLPDGANFSDSSTRITVLDGLKRIKTKGAAEPNNSSLTVTFDEPIAAKSLLRLEVEDMSFPSAGGDYQVTGSYTTADGTTNKLEASPSIAIIANTPLQSLVSALDKSPVVAAWNSNQFLGMFFNPQLLVTSMVSLFSGWLLCLVIVVAAYPFAIVIGLAFSFLKMSKHRLLRALAAIYINVLRGTPLFLQIYIMFFGLPMVGININNNLLGVCVMAVNSSAYLAEIFRAGIQSIPRGQYEAAASLGMNRAQTMLSIILPQTVRRVLPTVTSDFITAYKDTSLLSSVGVMELMMYAKNLTTVSGNITPYVAAAIFYLIVTLPLIKVVGMVEHHLARSESGAGPRPKQGQATPKAAADKNDSSQLSSHLAVHVQATPQGSLTCD